MARVIRSSTITYNGVDYLVWCHTTLAGASASSIAWYVHVHQHTKCEPKDDADLADLLRLGMLWDKSELDMPLDEFLCRSTGAYKRDNYGKSSHTN